MAREPIEDRLWAKVNKDAAGGCWEFLGNLTRGYGNIWDATRQMNRKAHIVAYELLVGPVGEGLQLDHLCRNRRCVNPAHLEPVTQRTNTLRGVSPVAKHAAQTACLHGHPLSGTNVRYNCYGHRVCVTCARMRAKKYYAASREIQSRESEESRHGVHGLFARGPL